MGGGAWISASADRIWCVSSSSLLSDSLGSPLFPHARDPRFSFPGPSAVVLRLGGWGGSVSAGLLAMATLYERPRDVWTRFLLGDHRIRRGSRLWSTELGAISYILLIRIRSALWPLSVVRYDPPTAHSSARRAPPTLAPPSCNRCAFVLLHEGPGPHLRPPLHTQRGTTIFSRLGLPPQHALRSFFLSLGLLHWERFCERACFVVTRASRLACFLRDPSELHIHAVDMKKAMLPLSLSRGGKCGAMEDAPPF